MPPALPTSNAPSGCRRPPSWRGLRAGVALLGALVFASAFAQPPGLREYQLKAVFLLNFANFTEWPESVFKAADAPFLVGVLGEDPFGPVLDEAVRGESVRGHPVLIRRSARPSDLAGCQIVFISTSERRHVREALAVFQHAPVLTVSDLPEFARDGGMVAFYLGSNRVRFEINPTVVREHGLKLSSRVLSLARIVGPP